MPSPERTELRLPPQDIDAERSLIGSVLVFNEMLDELPHVQPEHFYFESHQHVWRAIRSMQQHGDRAYDAQTVSDALKKAGKFADAGGEDVLRSALESVPHGQHAPYYARIVLEKYARRQVILSHSEAINYAYDPVVDIDDLLGKTEATVHGLLETRMVTTTMPKSIGELLAETFARLNTKRPTGLMTGFSDLDNLTAGLHPGNLVVLAARPSVGKTSLAVGLSRNLCRDDKGVLFVSLEQSADEIAERFLAAETGISAYKLRTSNVDDAEMSLIAEANCTINLWPIQIEDRQRGISEIHAAARIHRRKSRLDLLIIDYLELIQPEDRSKQREQQIADISRGLKQLARALGVPIVILSQMNREVEKRENRRPRMSDLRGSGAIEADADLILFLDRPFDWDVDADPKRVDVHLAKHRNGARGQFSLEWDAAAMRFLGPWTAPVSFEKQARETKTLGFVEGNY